MNLSLNEVLHAVERSSVRSGFSPTSRSFHGRLNDTADPGRDGHGCTLTGQEHFAGESFLGFSDIYVAQKLKVSCFFLKPWLGAVFGRVAQQNKHGGDERLKELPAIIVACLRRESRSRRVSAYS